MSFTRSFVAGSLLLVLPLPVLKAETPADDKDNLTVWVKRPIPSRDVTLHTDLAINGETVGRFTSDTDRPIGKCLKKGWNTLTFKTAPQPGPAEDNQLVFRFGPVRKDAKTGRKVMAPVLWEFRNGTDWKVKNRQWVHRRGPDTKEVTLTYRVYYAGPEGEAQELKAGDYVVQGWLDVPTSGTPLTVTVFVNGTPLNTFVKRREVVVTPLLKKGKNEIRIVSTRVTDCLADNTTRVMLAGPAEWVAGRQRFQVKPLVERSGLTGWERDRKTGQLVNKVKPGENEIEFVTTFNLDEAPKVAGR
jgi:hypothetical protein